MGGWFGLGYRVWDVEGGFGVRGCFVGFGCLFEDLYLIEEVVKWIEDSIEEGLVGYVFFLFDDKWGIFKLVFILELDNKG